MKFFALTILILNAVFTQEQTVIYDNQGSEIRIIKNVVDSLLPITNERPITKSKSSGWVEKTNVLTSEVIYIGPGDYYLPDLFVRTANYRLLFRTYPTVNAKMQISYNNGSSWSTLRDGSNYDSGWVTLPWSQLGEHVLKIRYLQISGSWVYRTFKVFMVPDITRMYVDGEGNSLKIWSNGTNQLDKPTVIVEGFDASNRTFSEQYYNISKKLIDQLSYNGNDYAFLNFADGGRDLKENSEVLDSALRFLNSIQNGNSKTILFGLSMGGVISRYTLAKAEANLNPLHVSHFFSVDAPQQYAVFDRIFLDYLKSKDVSTDLSSIAAKQLLVYNPFDTKTGTSQSIHSMFYSDLNSLNGDGYPSLIKNIGISFSNGNTNTSNSDEWLFLDVSALFIDDAFEFIDDPDRSFYLTNETKQAGSLLPISATNKTSLVDDFFSWGLERYENPTFIPYNSSLDIRNGHSKFDKTIVPHVTSFHDVLPDDIIPNIIDELDIPDMTATISGPYSLQAYQNANFSVQVLNGLAPYTNFEWYYKLVSNHEEPMLTQSKITPKNAGGDDINVAPFDVWYPIIGNIGTISRQMGQTPFTLKCFVTDSRGQRVESSFKHVSLANAGIFENRTDDDVFTKIRAYPNPFNPFTTIEYYVKNKSAVSIKIYNTLGQLIKDYGTIELDKGTHSVRWDATGNSSGLYIYSIKIGEKIQNGKILLIK
jgi:hypothetical protein